MENISRREFGKGLLSSVLSYALLQTAFERDLFAQAVRPILEKWLKGIHQLCGDLRTNKISQIDWQDQIGELHDRISTKELLRFLDFGKLAKQMDLSERGEDVKPFQFPKLDWLPGADYRGWGMSVFAVESGNAVSPHGHYNMVSAHLVLKGSFHVRHFDRLEEHAEHWVIKPTIDRVSRPGDETSISEKKDNIHWLKNIGKDRAYTLDVVVAGLDPSLDYSFKQTFLDPDGADKLSGGLLRARKIKYDESARLYKRNR